MPPTVPSGRPARAGLARPTLIHIEFSRYTAPDIGQGMVPVNDCQANRAVSLTESDRNQDRPCSGGSAQNHLPCDLAGNNGGASLVNPVKQIRNWIRHSRIISDIGGHIKYGVVLVILLRYERATLNARLFLPSPPLLR